MDTRRRLANASHQNRLAARLRAIPEERALAVVKQIISRDPQIGLKLANRILRRPAFLEEIFRDGLCASNESTARFWVESLAPRLGAVRMIEMIRQRAATDPAIARKFLYWLPSLVDGDDAAKPHLERLRQLLAQHATG